MAACDKEHLFFEQAHSRLLGDINILAYISFHTWCNRLSFACCKGAA